MWGLQKTLPYDDEEEGKPVDPVSDACESWLMLVTRLRLTLSRSCKLKPEVVAVLSAWLAWAMASGLSGGVIALPTRNSWPPRSKLFMDAMAS